jgi:hypothetical protein
VARTPEIMCAGRAARFLGVSAKTLRRWELAGDGPPRSRKGKRFYYVRQCLVDWLKANAPRMTTAARPAPEMRPPLSVAQINGHARPRSALG